MVLLHAHEVVAVGGPNGTIVIHNQSHRIQTPQTLTLKILGQIGALSNDPGSKIATLWI